MEELGSESALLITAGECPSTSELPQNCPRINGLIRFGYFVDRNRSDILLLNTFSGLPLEGNTGSPFCIKTKDEIKPGTNLTSCVFIRACIDEAMRLAPPIPAILPRVALPGGITVDGHFFGAGTDIGVPPYAVMRNLKYYLNKPNEFIPERWIESPENSRKNIELAQSAFCPFSIGPRSCIAKGLAYVELTIALARILWEFDLKREEGSTVGDYGNGGYAIKDHFITKKEGPMVQFRPRLAE
jgi:hypothetical protein